MVVKKELKELKELKDQFVSDVISVAKREKKPEDLMKYVEAFQRNSICLMEVSPEGLEHAGEGEESPESQEELRRLADEYGHRVDLPKHQWIQRKEGESVRDLYNRRKQKQGGGEGE